MLVTTGGQQVIDLVCKTLIDPGDVIVAEAPTYPGAVPSFRAYEADVVQIPLDSDGMRIDDLEETLDALEREGRRPKFIYTVPTFQNPAGVTMSLPRRKRLVEVAAERELLDPRGQPVRPAALRGRSRCRRCTRSTAATSSSTSERSRRSSRRACASAGRSPGPGARQDERRQAGRRPVHVLDDPVLRGGVLRGDPLAGLPGVADRHLPAPARHHARRPGRALPAGVDVPARRAGCSCGRRCPTTSTRATCSRARSRRTSRSSPVAPRSSTAAARRRCA